MRERFELSPADMQTTVRAVGMLMEPDGYVHDGYYPLSLRCLQKSVDSALLADLSRPEFLGSLSDDQRELWEAFSEEVKARKDDTVLGIEELGMVAECIGEALGHTSAARAGNNDSGRKICLPDGSERPHLGDAIESVLALMKPAYGLQVATMLVGKYFGSAPTSQVLKLLEDNLANVTAVQEAPSVHSVYQDDVSTREALVITQEDLETLGGSSDNERLASDSELGVWRGYYQASEYQAVTPEMRRVMEMNEAAAQIHALVRIHDWYDPEFFWKGTYQIGYPFIYDSRHVLLSEAVARIPGGTEQQREAMAALTNNPYEGRIVTLIEYADLLQRISRISDAGEELVSQLTEKMSTGAGAQLRQLVALDYEALDLRRSPLWFGFYGDTPLRGRGGSYGNDEDNLSVVDEMNSYTQSTPEELFRLISDQSLRPEGDRFLLLHMAHTIWQELTTTTPHIIKSTELTVGHLRSERITIGEKLILSGVTAIQAIVREVHDKGVVLDIAVLGNDERDIKVQYKTKFGMRVSMETLEERLTVRHPWHIDTVTPARRQSYWEKELGICAGAWLGNALAECVFLYGASDTERRRRWYPWAKEPVFSAPPVGMYLKINRMNLQVVF